MHQLQRMLFCLIVCSLTAACAQPNHDLALSFPKAPDYVNAAFPDAYTFTVLEFSYSSNNCTALPTRRIGGLLLDQCVRHRGIPDASFGTRTIVDVSHHRVMLIGDTVVVYEPWGARSDDDRAGGPCKRPPDVTYWLHWLRPATSSPTVPITQLLSSCRSTCIEHTYSSVDFQVRATLRDAPRAQASVTYFDDAVCSADQVIYGPEMLGADRLGDCLSYQDAQGSISQRYDCVHNDATGELVLRESSYYDAECREVSRQRSTPANRCMPTWMEEYGNPFGRLAWLRFSCPTTCSKHQEPVHAHSPLASLSDDHYAPVSPTLHWGPRYTLPADPTPQLPSIAEGAFGLSEYACADSTCTRDCIGRPLNTTVSCAPGRPSRNGKA
jgi:hypothetical protein